MRRVTVAVEPKYDVVVGAGALGALAEVVAGRRRTVIVTQTHLLDALKPHIGDRLGPDPWIVTMDDGESAKTLATVEDLCRAFAAGGLLRDDVVVALGGGLVGDTAGFAAAVYHRGVDVVQAPTSLLAQVDAAIGGKTAVNLPEGKNLVGAFHQPIAVVCDTALLATLPAPDFRSGLGEIAKYACMPEGAEIVDLLRLRTDAVLARDADALATLVGASVAIKAAIIEADPHERSGRRAVLNYGHTFAHALETTTAAVGGVPMPHGEAVGVGLVFDVHLAHAIERVGLDVVDRVHGVVAGLGLPVAVPAAVARDDLVAVMRRDKKSTGGLTFVLPGPDGLSMVDDPPDRALDAAFAAVGVASHVGG
ncbi:MAG TPA: 3-dehydroquinate synthase family protein [Acidimicrobiia bacterium]|nr:3-dehydroquinate synthase family protein [Acidimicrobiia bacterium]